MGKLNRGNLLATLKKLKKMPRPKVVIANPAVQAICGGSSITPNKKADLKAVIERRRALMSEHNRKPIDMSAFMKVFDDGFMRFCENLKVERSKKLESKQIQVSEDASDD